MKTTELSVTQRNATTPRPRRSLRQTLGLVVLGAFPILGMSCASLGAPTPLPAPELLVSPTPIQGNQGKFMCPYTSDGTVAGWVSSAMKTEGASSIGGSVGSFVGGRVMRSIPFVGGFLGSKVGSSIAKEAAIKGAGGWESIRESSDLSFNGHGDMAVYLYANHSAHPDYQGVVSATGSIYPDFKKSYHRSILNAGRGN